MLLRQLLCNGFKLGLGLLAGDPRSQPGDRLPELEGAWGRG
jgi:hypothetical protein